MQPIARAALVAILVFWAICALFFVQPFTGWFLVFAIPAAIVAVTVFVALRSRLAPPTQGSRPGPATAAVLVGVVLILLGLLLAFGRWPMLGDPCHTWEDDSQSKTTGPDSPCSTSSSTTQSRTNFLLQSMAGEGVLLVGGATAVWAGLYGSRLSLALIGVAMLLPTVILFQGMSIFFMAAFLLGVALVVVALLMPPPRRLEASPQSA